MFAFTNDSARLSIPVFRFLCEMVVFKFTLLGLCIVVSPMARPAPMKALTNLDEVVNDGASARSESDCMQVPNMSPTSGHQVVFEVVS